MRHEKWFDPEPAEVIDLTADFSLQRILDAYCDAWRPGETWNRRILLQNVLDIAYRQLGAKTAVIERRYTDVDFRDEHARFYSQTFRHYPAATHRMHFFREAPPHDVYHPEVAAVFDDLEYLGYVVLRPVQGATVGRTVLAVPEELKNHVTCISRDQVNFFGKSYTVEGTPFIGQDNQLGICAHAAAWIASYYHHLRYGGRRILPGDITDAVATALTAGRSIPMPGMRLEQLCDALEAIDIPPVVYYTRDSEPRDIEKIARRYLDSALPVIVGTTSHAFTLVGYQHGRRGQTTFICQDDEVGPYQKRRRPAFNWSSKSWQYLIAPVPPQLYLRCEVVEPLARARIRQDLDQITTDPKTDPYAKEEARRVLDRLKVGHRAAAGFGFVTSAIRSNEFKSTLLERGYSEQVARGYMRLPMSKWIWVVELVELDSFRARRTSIIAEAIIDSTEHIRDFHVLAWRVPGKIRHWNGDREEVGEMDIALDQSRGFSVCATSHLRELSPR